jgi:hypothetical protein
VGEGALGFGLFGHWRSWVDLGIIALFGRISQIRRLARRGRRLS